MRRISGAFEVHRTDVVTGTILGAWLLGEVSTVNTKRRFVLIKKLPGGGIAAVSAHSCLVEALNALNNILESYGICRGFTMEDLARLS